MVIQAAAQQLQHWREKDPSILLNTVKKFMENGLLDRGERGEVVARMLILEAFDHAVLSAGKLKDPYGKYPLYSFGCRLIDWIVSLFVDDVTQDILHSKPANCGEKTFEEVFKDAWIRLTHWAQAGDDHVFNTHSMFAAFIRCMAFVCRRGESFIDLIIPVLLWNETIKSSVMTAVFIQVKRRTKAGGYTFDAEKHFKFFHPEPNLAKDDRPYVTLVMDLGVQNTLPKYAKLPVQDVIKKSRQASKRMTTATSSNANTPPATPSKSKETLQPKTPSKHNVAIRPSSGHYVSTQKHPRYEIYVSGCSNTNYKLITEEQRVKYREVLRLSEFLLEHPRKETIPQVMQLKPVFALGPDSYSWADSFVLNITDPQDDDEDIEEGHIVGHPDSEEELQSSDSDVDMGSG